MKVMLLVQVNSFGALIVMWNLLEIFGMNSRRLCGFKLHKWLKMTCGRNRFVFLGSICIFKKKVNAFIWAGVLSRGGTLPLVKETKLHWPVYLGSFHSLLCRCIYKLIFFPPKTRFSLLGSSFWQNGDHYF